MKHVLLSTGLIMASISLTAQNGTVADFRKISESTGNLIFPLAEDGNFGYVHEGKSASHIISSAPFDGNGAMYFIELNPDGAVQNSIQLKADDFEYFADKSNSEFGTAAIALSDQNGDGQSDYLVGSPGIGAFGGLFLLLSNEASGFDLETIALPQEMENENARIGLFLHNDGSHVLISSMHNEGKIFRCSLNNLNLTLEETIDIGNSFLSGKLEIGDRFGSGITTYDINGDGNKDILCGAPGDDDQNTDFGAVYLLYRDGSKNITGIQKLSRLEGDFGGFMNTGDEFGISVRGIGDIDENGADDIAVGAPGDDDGGLDIGSVWILFMRPDGTVRDERKINRLAGNFTGDINFQDAFGTRIATIGDHNSDGTIDFVAGSVLDDDGGSDKGALFTIFVEQCPSPSGFFTWEADGGTVQFSAEGGPGYNHIWNFDDGGYSQEQNPIHTYQSNGTYWVCLAITSDCGGNNYCQNVFIQTLSTEEAFAQEIAIYPNPASSILNVRLPLEAELLSIIDITGKEVIRMQNPSIQNEVNLSELSPGIYFTDVRGNGYRVVKKLNIVR